MDFLSIKQKTKNPYKVTGINKAVKDVDESRRIVTGVFNSYFYIDSDLDMLLPNAAKKSIQERGVGSTKGNKIKHLQNHNWDKNIADIRVLDERTVDINGRQVQGIYHESYYPTSRDSDDQLIKIQSGMYDARSIGFKYINIVLAQKDSENEVQRKAWDEYLPLAINPEVAEESGFFWVVKEIQLWEGSDVTFGANELTPMLGIKSGDSLGYKDMLLEKIDVMDNIFKKGNLTDEGFHTLEMEKNQLKALINQYSFEPSLKDTLKSRQNEDTKTTKSNVKRILF